MVKRYTNKKHLNWIHTLMCIVDNEKCSFPIQAHHLLKPFDGIKGMGRKANDKNLVPLCLFHHTELHRMGSEYKFSKKYFNQETRLKETAQQLWLRSPYYEQNK
mgnify:CR=1 FL=1